MRRNSRVRSTFEVSFPDRELTRDELKRFSSAVKKAGGKDKWMASKGFVGLDKNGLVRSVKIVEGTNGTEVLKGSGIMHHSDIPFQWWNSVGFAQLEKYERSVEYAKNHEVDELDRIASTVA